MSSNGDDRARLVHKGRKTIKRMRALARLLRYEIGEHEFRRVNGSLRDAGKQLAPARDARVRFTTLQDLLDRYPDELSGEKLQTLLARLRCASLRTDRDQTASIDIAAMRGDLARWSLLGHEGEELTAGLRSIYKSGRRRYKRARRTRGRDPVRMHDWRKRVKSLYYALDMLGGKQSPATKKLARRADRLGEALGQEHDLAMLDEYLRAQEHLDRETQAKLSALIEHRRARLRKRALKLGSRLYAHRPRRFAARAVKALSR